MLLQFLKLWVSVEIMGSFIYKKKLGRRCLFLSNFFLSNFHPTLVSVTISKGNGIINSPSSATKGNQSEWTGPPDPIRWFPTQCSYRRRKKKKNRNYPQWEKNKHPQYYRFPHSPKEKVNQPNKPTGQMGDIMECHTQLHE